MYKIYSEVMGTDGKKVRICIHDDTVETDELKVLEPKLHLQDSNAGSLEFKVAPNNIAYFPITQYYDIATGIEEITRSSIASSGLTTGELDPDTAAPITPAANNSVYTTNLITLDSYEDQETGKILPTTTVDLSWNINEAASAISTSSMAHSSTSGSHLDYPADSYINVENSGAITFFGQYTNDDFPSGLIGRSGIEDFKLMMLNAHLSSDSYLTIVDSPADNYQLASDQFAAVIAAYQRPFSITFTVANQNKRSYTTKWRLAYYIGTRGYYAGDWASPDEYDSSTGEGTVNFMLPLGTSKARILCKFVDGGLTKEISPSDFGQTSSSPKTSSITYTDKSELYYRALFYKYSEGEYTSVSSTDFIQQGVAVDIPEEATHAKLRIIRGSSPGPMPFGDDWASKISGQSYLIYPHITPILFWYKGASSAEAVFDHSTTYEPNANTQIIEVPSATDPSDLITMFRIELKAADGVDIHDKFDSATAITYIESGMALKRTTYEIDPLGRMEATIIVCKDMTTKTYSDHWRWKVYDENEITNAFVDYEGNEYTDMDDTRVQCTLMGSYQEVGDGARAIEFKALSNSGNQNATIADVKWGVVAYHYNSRTSEYEFLHCERWMGNPSEYDHLGVIDGIKITHFRIMIQYTERNNEPRQISYSDFSQIATHQTWEVINRQEKEIWEGRVLSEDVDFWNCRNIHCEGELSYLNDTLQPPKAYNNYTIPLFFKAVIDIHNSKSTSARQFTLGQIWDPYSDTAPGTTTNIVTQYESTLEIINKLVEDYGGHIKVYKQNGKRMIDWVKDIDTAESKQTINFGENLLDFTRNYDMSQLCTVVMPTGEVVQEGESSRAGEPLSINNGKGPTSGQLLYLGDNDRVYIQKGANLGGYKTGVAVVEPGKTYYFSGRLHGGYVAYTIKSNRDGTGDYYQGGTVTAGSADKVGFEDFLDKEIKIPEGAHSVVMCSFGNDIQMALKKQIEEVEGIDIVLTVDEVADDTESDGTTWHKKGSPYVSNPRTLAKYGWIEKRLNLEEVTDAQTLYNAAKKYLQDGQFEEMSLEVTAIDLNSLGALVDNINLYDNVRVISEPHGLDRVFPVTEIDIPLDDPAGQTFTLGVKQEVSLSEASSSVDEKLAKQIATAPTTAAVIREAKRNAALAINNATSGSYITMKMDDNGHPCELIISNMENYQDPTANVWRWNKAGLAHSTKGYNLTEFNTNVAITADGRVIANEVIGNHFEGVTIDGGHITIGANSTPGVENELIIRSSSNTSSYVKFKADTGTGKGRVIFGYYKQDGNSTTSVDYASIEDYSISQQGGGVHRGIRILGNGGNFTGSSNDGGLILIQTDDLAVSKWNNANIRTGYTGTITVGGDVRNVDVLNGFIVGAY